jgi:hypothetical protein
MQKGRTIWSWDEESKADLRELSEAGYRAADIANKLSVKFGATISRCAVIGARYRWAIDGGEIKKRARMSRKPKIQHATEPRPRRQHKRQVPRPPMTIAIPFVDRRPWECAFPVEGTGINMLCCGGKSYQYGGGGSNLKHTRFPYCWYHCNVAYRWRAPVDEHYIGHVEHQMSRPESSYNTGIIPDAAG